MRASGLATPRSVAAYFERLPPKQRATLQHLRKTIKSVVPNAEEVISYQIPAFKEERIIIHYAAFKDHCSLFVGASIRHDLAKELKRFEGGKGTVQFTDENPISDALVKRIVKIRVAELAARKVKAR